jgi:glycosyltransferase involved in cell wall biosynthesis
VAEVMAHGVQGHLVPFFDVPRWMEAIVHLLNHPAERERLGQQARLAMVEKYDLHKVCLPQQLAWVNGLMQA